ncbi:MAG: class II aldolase/adducin family protein [Cyanobacteria bacterium]|nr:class II aldolase/adducin family protein [Cyanobacteriota bacterium]MDW8199768.1 class II aldolase/adducin family protein [Cyanobacteriota bacterium SKYGB_h_bin112]
MAIDEGVIKFHCQWIQGRSPDPELIADLMQWRERLYQAGLIGAYPNGIGFGNISQRVSTSNQFIITGTQTGCLPRLSHNDYTLVTTFDLGQNTLTCVGQVKASSESLTHAAIYHCQPWVMGIIHVHHRRLWEQLLFQVPTTRADVPYGTPQMAGEMERLFREEDLATRKILVMAGHDDGVMTIGHSLDEAGELLLGVVADLMEATTS